MTPALQHSGSVSRVYWCHEQSLGNPHLDPCEGASHGGTCMQHSIKMELQAPAQSIRHRMLLILVHCNFESLKDSP